MEDEKIKVVETVIVVVRCKVLFGKLHEKEILDIFVKEDKIAKINRILEVVDLDFLNQVVEDFVLVDVVDVVIVKVEKNSIDVDKMTEVEMTIFVVDKKDNEEIVRTSKVVTVVFRRLKDVILKIVLMNFEKVFYNVFFDNDIMDDFI